MYITKNGTPHVLGQGKIICKIIALYKIGRKYIDYIYYLSSNSTGIEHIV